MTGYIQHFDITNYVNLLRLICGLYFIPHLLAKFTVPETLNFFKEANFKPAAAWLYTAGVIEAAVTICLVLAIYTPYAALVGAIFLAVAGAATYKVTKKWIWLIGGAEFCVFWSLMCIVLAMATWPK